MTPLTTPSAPGLLGPDHALSDYLGCLLGVGDVTAEPLSAPGCEAMTGAQCPHERPARQESATGVAGTAGKPLQVVLFSVRGLNVAVRLQDVTGIIQWPEKFCPNTDPNCPSLGVLGERGDGAVILDPARVVIPATRHDLLAASPQYHNIILVEGGAVGLACDGIAKVVSVAPAHVTWRSSGTHRRWLAGTIAEHRCALLDVRMFLRLLANAGQPPAPGGA